MALEKIKYQQYYELMHSLKNTLGVVYHRDRPCIRCGSHLFSIKRNRCRACECQRKKFNREKDKHDRASIYTREKPCPNCNGVEYYRHAGCRNCTLERAKARQRVLANAGKGPIEVQITTIKLGPGRIADERLIMAGARYDNIERGFM